MVCTVNETLAYVRMLTRHVEPGDVQGAILTVLMELGLNPLSDGFTHLRKAIDLRYQNPEQRINQIYGSVGKMYEEKLGQRLVESAIRTAIDAAWRGRDNEKWGLFSTQDVDWTEEKPSNGDFIATLACFMELWSRCSKEAGYGIE